MVMPRDEFARLSPISPLPGSGKSNGKKTQRRYVATVTVEFPVFVSAATVDEAEQRARREVETRYGRSTGSSTVVVISVEGLGDE